MIQGFVSLFCFLVFTFTSFGFASTPEPTNVYEQWDQSDLKVETALDQLQPQICFGTPRNYSGCYEAFNRVLIESRSQILKAPGVPERPYYGRMIRNFGSWELRELLKEKIPVPQTLKENHAFYLLKLEETKAVRTNLQDAKNLPNFEELRNYVFQVPKNKRKYYAALGFNTFATSALDSHMQLMTLKNYEKFYEKKEVETYAGTGLVLANLSQAFVIKHVLPNTPAQQAGLKKGDIVYAIDGSPIAEEDLSFKRDRFVGPKDSFITLTIKRQEQKFDVKLQRVLVAFDNILTDIETAQNGEKILYVQVEDFLSPTLCQKFTSQIQNAFRENRIKNIVIDLRNNGGGSLENALCMAGAFLPFGTKMLSAWNLQSQSMDSEYYQIFSQIMEGTILPKTGEIQTAKVSQYNAETPHLRHLLKNRPIVILVNEKSASASEVFAGILQENTTGVLVGTRTYGKGCIQNVYGIQGSHTLALKSTISRFHFASGRTNQKIGILPDHQVFLDKEDQDNEPYKLREAEAAPYSPGAVPYNDLLINQKNRLKLISCAALRNLQQNKGDDFQMTTAIEAATCF